MTDEGTGAYYEARMPDGTFVSGTADDEEHAQELIRAMEQSQSGVVQVITCQHCPRGVAYNAQKKRWYHALAPGRPIQCPGQSTTAFPAPPKSRDRPHRRGLWANDAGPRNNTCGPDE